MTVVGFHWILMGYNRGGGGGYIPKGRTKAEERNEEKNKGTVD